MLNKLRWIVVVGALALFVAVVLLRFRNHPAPESVPSDQKTTVQSDL